MQRDLTFTFSFADRAWTVTSPDGPGAIGIHEEPYEALMDCAFTMFDLIDEPDMAPKYAQQQYHQMNLDFHPYFPHNEEEEDEPDERVLSPDQLARARRFSEFFKDG